MKCVVITGNGSVFSAGFDLSEFTRAAEDETSPALDRQAARSLQNREQRNGPSGEVG